MVHVVKLDNLFKLFKFRDAGLVIKFVALGFAQGGAGHGLVHHNLHIVMSRCGDWTDLVRRGANPFSEKNLTKIF